MLDWQKKTFTNSYSHQYTVKQCWRDTNISPAFKKGRPDDPATYHPLSLTSNASKLLEHIVHKAVMDHLDNLHLLSTVQHGFRKERSCETNYRQSSKTLPTHLGHCLLTWDIAYSLGTLPTHFGHCLLTWDIAYSLGTLPTHLGHCLLTWDISY